MTEKQLKEIFKGGALVDADVSSYNREQWKIALNAAFEKVDYFAKQNNLAVQNGYTVSCKQLGSIMLNDSKSIALFEVEVADSINIERNRKGLRDIAAKYIDQNIVHAALVFYFSPNQDSYRLTLIAKWSDIDQETGELVIGETQKKRFTYLFGSKESGTTPAKRFCELINKRESLKLGLSDIIDAFSVEKLNSEFFKKYKERYDKFNTYLKEHTHYRHALFNIHKNERDDEREKNEIVIRDFTKKLLGRIVFLYFLQKKGWMGVPTPTDGNMLWEGGKISFLHSLFKECELPQKFHSKYLSALFYDTLNNGSRVKSVFHVEGKSPFSNNIDVSIPFLNGGLFEDDFPNGKLIDFPVEYFSDLFDFFDQYNFTIDENSPEDHEVGIDPEMLGHIFENLLEDNKDKGTFYTPRQIVHYMCQSSLIQYLKTHLPKDTNGTIDDFIRHGVIGDTKNKKNFIVVHAKRIEELLDKVKICDPAIGSGAFPMGMLQEIFKAKLSLDLTLDRAKAKKEIIQNSIYGIDIEKGAVDIARLRFWLSLVVDEDEPQPLPNLDYKIMQGNSLLERFEGIDLSKIHDSYSYEVKEKSLQINIFSGQSPKKVTQSSNVNRIEDLIRTYFSADTADAKRELHKLIDKQILDHIHHTLQDYNEGLSKQAKALKKNINNKTSLLSNADQKIKYQADSKEAKKLKEIERELENIVHKEIELSRLSQSTDRPFFLWHLFFKDVFDDNGFDIVIGNPPYVQLQKMGVSTDKLEQAGFETFTRTGDIYCLFYEIGFKVLKPNGILSFITSNKWMRAAYGEVLRKYFIDNTNPITLIDFSGYKVFDSATVDTNILIAQKAPFQNHVSTCVLGKGFSLNNMSDYFRQNSNYTAFNLESSWTVLSSIEQNIKLKIEKAGKRLKDWDINIYRGILTGYNEAFIINTEIKEELIKTSPNSAEIIRPILRGRDIQKYTSVWDGLYIISTFPSLKLDIENYPGIKDHFLSFGKERLEQTGEKHRVNGELIVSRKKTGNKWFETQDQIGYWKDLEKPKIIWKRIGSVLRFCYDETGLACLDSTCFATGTDMKYLTGLLNSTMCKKMLLDNAPKTGTGDVITSVQALEPILIPNANNSQKLQIVALVDKCINQLSKNVNSDISFLEKQIDAIVFKLYGLSDEEIQFYSLAV